MSLLVTLRWRFLPRKLPGLCQKRLLLPFSFILIFVVYFVIRQQRNLAFKNATAPSFNFNLINTPYIKLNNSQCLLLRNGLWDCPDIRLQGSNRLRQSQLVAVRLLRIFDALCKKHRLRYWITRGTLLGAVRHGGYIPWDTDLDVEMPVEDYIKFVQNVQYFPPGMGLQRGRKEANFEHVFQSETKDNVQSATNMLMLAKALRAPSNPRLRDEKSCYRYCLKYNCPANWPDGIMNDIYPVLIKDDFFQDQFERISLITRIYRKLIKSLGYQFGYRAFPLVYLKFEGFDVPVINDCKKVLKDTYGSDYMTLLAREKRRPPDDLVPDPLHSCAELQKSGTIKK